MHDLLIELGCDCAVGVPDTGLAALISRLETAIPVHAAPREDVAVAVGCGLRLGGRLPVLYMKNAGLLTCGDVLLSLARDISCSVLLVVGWAGSGSDTLPHHVVSGERTVAFLDALGIAWRDQTTAVAESTGTRAWAHALLGSGQHCALLVPPGATHAR